MPPGRAAAGIGHRREESCPLPCVFLLTQQRVSPPVPGVSILQGPCGGRPSDQNLKPRRQPPFRSSPRGPSAVRLNCKKTHIFRGNAAQGTRILGDHQRDWELFLCERRTQRRILNHEGRATVSRRHGMGNTCVMSFMLFFTNV